MVSQPTVIIVGAGGSIPYGFPSGSQLVKAIVADLGKPTNLRNLVDSLGYNDHQQRSFGQELGRSQAASIDAFLETRVEYLDIGRAAIAASLLPLESEQRLLAVDDWYSHLARRIISNIRQGFSEQLTIVTFNYDRSLDHALQMALQHSFAAGEGMKHFQKIKIIHVHGYLCPLPSTFATGTRTWAYGVFSTERLEQAAQSIKIIHEHKDDSPELTAAKHELEKAKRVCFLGFGFHPINVRRLWMGLQQSRAVPRGTAYDMTASERDLVLRQVERKLVLTDPAWDCLRFLRENTDLVI